MKATELRIKNLFLHGERLCEVVAIFRTHFICDEVGTGIQIGNSLQENFQPIPLTEEWLTKFEIKKWKQILNNTEYGHLNVNGKIHSVWLYNGVFTYSISTLIGDAIACDIEIKYVHRFQNLYFELTGKEL